MTVDQEKNPQKPSKATKGFRSSYGFKSKKIRDHIQYRNEALKKVSNPVLDYVERRQAFDQMLELEKLLDELCWQEGGVM